VVLKDEIRIYYSGQARPHGWQPGWLCLARLRPDGFAGYEQIAGGSNKTAIITTKPVVAVTGSLRLSADVVISGFVKVTVLDEENKALAESERITQTVTDATVRWKNGFSLRSRKGKSIRLRFELRDAKVYSFNFHE
jgi:hypothetical protein